VAESSFDELIHAPLRLRICSLLGSVESMAFAVVRDNLGITDAHLSKQVKILADAGYVAATKQGVASRVDARKTTWLSLTPAGRKAFEAHVTALRDLLAAPNRTRTSAAGWSSTPDGPPAG